MTRIIQWPRAHDEWRALDIRIQNQAKTQRTVIANKANALRAQYSARFAFLRLHNTARFAELRKELLP